MADELVQEEDFSDNFNSANDESGLEVSTETHAVDNLNTHQRLKSNISGSLTKIDKNEATVKLVTTYDMVVDELGLVYNGSIFSAANYAAICAINVENVIVIGSKINFLAPAKVGDVITFEANSRFEDSRKREVNVVGRINEIKVFDGVFHAVVLEKHIFKTKIKNANREY